MPPTPSGYTALTGFCRYPGTDIPGYDLGCYTPQPGACPLGANATSATLQAAAEACQANPGCHAYTSDGWLKATGQLSFASRVEYLGGPGQGLYTKRPSTGSVLDSFCFYQSQDIFGNTLSRGTAHPDAWADGANAPDLAALCLATPGCLGFNTQQYLKRSADLALVKPLPAVFPNPGQGLYIRATLPAREFALTSFCPYPGQDIVGSNISCGLPAAQGGCGRGRAVSRAQLLGLAGACASTPGCLAFTSDGWLKSEGAEALHPPPVSYMTGPLQGAYVLRPKVLRYATDAFCFYPGRDVPPGGPALLLLDADEADAGTSLLFRNAQALAQMCLQASDCLAFTTAAQFRSDADAGALVPNATKFGTAREGTYIRAVLPAPMDQTLCAVVQPGGRVRCIGSGMVMGGSSASVNGSYINLGTNTGPVKMVASHVMAQHACAVFESGKMKCWGAGSEGRLGLGDTATRNTPDAMGDALPYVNLGTNTTVSHVAIGQYSACAVVQPGGRVKCWGANINNWMMPLVGSQADSAGEVGDNMPAISLGSNVSASSVAVGYSHVCAIITEPTKGVKCWGGWDTLGYPSLPSRAANVPSNMGDSLPYLNFGKNVTEATQVVAGELYVCALLQPGGRVQCWGRGQYGATGNDGANLGYDHVDGAASPFVNVGTNVTVTQLAGGQEHVCALTNTGRVKCWGLAVLGYGQARGVFPGNTPGTMGDNRPYVDLGPDVAAVSSIAALPNGACALVQPGSRIKCWGPAPDYVTYGDAPGEMGTALPVQNMRL
ncbi:hypothetical protein HXX76_014503 [Chlamydomonas incerta]|uniref:Uncharacterized protein n=1 Tax=Chlamydomonas incerta TaxID=51695 RepID=A0A835VQX0_CHLIN|nr:hypothetical protein HXX76_014503 [Chlamydomonas incerta]|eukprot:KAG2424450.1 hypothetical protein HXX76_014503 [Chlamydomonas incerta]